VPEEDKLRARQKWSTGNIVLGSPELRSPVMEVDFGYLRYQFVVFKLVQEER